MRNLQSNIISELQRVIINYVFAISLIFIIIGLVLLNHYL
jgi:hypothetical protein